MINRKDPNVFFTNEFVSIWIEDEILFSNYTKGIVIDLDVAKKIVSDRLNFTKGIDYPILIDFSNMRSVTKEARDFMNHPEGGLKGLICGAFVGSSAVATLFVNLYLKINKPTVPAKFFTSKQEAIEWIKRIKQEKEILSGISKKI